MSMVSVLSDRLSGEESGFQRQRIGARDRRLDPTFARILLKINWFPRIGEARSGSGDERSKSEIGTPPKSPPARAEGVMVGKGALEFDPEPRPLQPRARLAGSVDVIGGRAGGPVDLFARSG